MAERAQVPLPYRVCTGLFLSLLGTGLVLGALEFYARGQVGAAADAQPAHPMYMPHPFIGYVLRPGLERPAVGPGAHGIRVNNLGFRGPDLPLEKPEGGLRIVCMGGSTTFCTGATSDEKTWPARLEQGLREVLAGPESIEVVNAGVPGYTTVESLINLELRLVELDPDVLMLYHAPNDARIMQTREFRPDYAHFRTDWTPPAGAAAEERPGGFALPRLLAGEAEEAKAPALHQYLFVENFEDLHVPSNREVLAEGLAVYERNVRMIAAVAASRGIPLVVMSFAFAPAGDQARLPRYDETIVAQNAILRRLSEELDLRFVDLNAAVEAVPENYTDWMHYSDRGCMAQARVLVERRVDWLKP